jgi:hypothetical protein
VALSGYQERLYKLAELAGRKVNRPQKAIPEQNGKQMNAVMQAWVAATATK